MWLINKNDDSIQNSYIHTKSLQNGGRVRNMVLNIIMELVYFSLLHILLLCWSYSLINVE